MSAPGIDLSGEKPAGVLDTTAVFHTREFVFKTPYSLLNPMRNESHSLLLSGIAAHMVLRSALQPFSVVKTRFQLQTLVPKPKYKTFLFSFVDIYESEGVRGLFRGLGPSILRIPLFMAIQYRTFLYLKHQVPFDYYTSTPLILSLSAVTATAATHPLTVLATRRQAIFSPRENKRVFWSGMLTRGLVPSMAGAAVLYSTSWFVYEKLKHVKTSNRLQAAEGDINDVQFSTGDFATAAAFGALVGCLLSHPFDVLRKRAMAEVPHNAPWKESYASGTMFWKAGLESMKFRAMWKAESAGLLVRGISATVMRGFPAAFLAAYVWESIDSRLDWIDRRGQDVDRTWEEVQPFAKSMSKKYSPSATLE
ncbi:mitochondrial solute carrier family 25 (mitochondrial folate transporter) member 32 [Andalucia godoyi]|uniref:Mitochondrial solute carrier family 25 (Mitochondrial folate transporter) member 32 n=1 Tax=Andalucia godoyi TaxID=505711 RepID=A0A8K0AHM2_ANDGO|nr:mitochondrial solute carrier family 25 (mitochondrial folate transporter) member 32 [Andalucia godoyi]|eukprot:ANDGO_03893.mRNA.1 mitochondrial solute carrier family 25 (mitochondrial folate transporter) member 32